MMRKSAVETQWSETTINELQKWHFCFFVFQALAMLPLYSCNVKIRLPFYIEVSRAFFKLAIVCVSDNLNDVMKEI